MKTLREARKAAGLQQYILAGLARVPNTEISRAETRGLRLTADQARRVAGVLEVDPTDVAELRAALDHEKQPSAVAV